MNTSEKIPFKLDINWKIILFSLLMLPVLVSLGIWQLQRADEKTTLQQSLTEQQALLPVSLDIAVAASDPQLNYRRVVFTGAPLTQFTWLLENQMQNGRLGYHVIVPMVFGDNEVIAVNFGWLVANDRRENLPELPVLPAEVTISGQLIKPTTNRLLQGQTSDTTWPKIILQLDTNLMAATLGQPLMPWVVQIDAGNPHALVVDWRNINMPASKHLAYAVQWFLLALALVILTVFANSNLGRRRR